MSQITTDVLQEIREIAVCSENRFSHHYFDCQMDELDYSNRDIATVFEKGEFTGKPQPEKGSDSVYSFCVAYKFDGDEEACHIRGWADLNNNKIDLVDVFNDADMCA